MRMASFPLPDVVAMPIICGSVEAALLKMTTPKDFSVPWVVMSERL